MAQDTIDKIINIQFRYSDLIKGWEAASAAIDTAKVKLQEFKKAGDSEGVAKQNQLIKALRTEMSAYTREIQANIREEINLDGSVEKLRAGVQALTAQYNKLSREERNNADVGGKLSSQIREMQTELNEANASLLNFRDNVGNYASAAKGFTPLTFQVQQLAREMPSLTMSFQQFFLAISNNLPMFADELTRARMANKALRAEGKPTVSVFKQVLSAIGSWQTALVVGITLLTAYGKEIGAWVKGLFTAKEAALSMAEAQDKVNDALKKDGYGIGEQIAKVKELQMQWRALGDDLKARKQFIVDNKDAFDDLGVQVNNVNDAEKLLVERTDDFIQSLQLRAQAAAAQKLASEQYEKYIKVVAETEDDLAKSERLRDYYIKQKAEREKMYGGLTADIYQRQIRASQAMINQHQAEIDKINEQRNAALDTGSIYTKLQAKYEKQAHEILDAAGIEEAANDKVNEKIKKGITLAEQRARAVKAARESIVKDIAAIGNALDKELADAFKDGNDEITKGLESQLKERTRKYQNRLLKAQTQGGDTNAQEEMIRIAQEQVNILQEQLQDVETFRTAYEAMGLSGIEIDNKRLEALKALQDAQKALQGAQNKAAEDERKAQERSTAMSIQSAQQLAGALGGLAEAAGADAGVVAMLAIAESAAAMGAALHKAFSSSATVWDGIAGAVAAISTITTIITQIKSLNSSAEEERSKYRYASGGLVTGPGTGTSDSIPAMLSNGEAVMTAQAVNDWGAMLSAMNVASGGNAIQVSNLPQRNDGMKGMERMMERALMNMPAPIVSVVDINKGQKRVKVQNNLGKLGRKKYE